ncbi:MAG TPA: hypothetical protein VL361_04835 [Candidatus Limnocylindrales bacterium]|jgi:hypothetical protein|nr:hypothetical protein [Candidatus Limnocylindrales bacterium]
MRAETVIYRKIVLSICFGLLVVTSAHSEVRISVQDSNGVAWINYQCTAGEVVRAFALDVSVDRGQITGLSGFFRGPCRVGATGYGIFPASFRDHISVGSGTNIDWDVADYSPLAVPADRPADTLPGLSSAGVTLEIGGLWDPNDSATIPTSSGLLCALQLSQPANVSVTANLSRGGLVSAFLEIPIQSVFVGGPVGPLITGASVNQGFITVLFHGGELQTAPTANGPWADTGDRSGAHRELVGQQQMKFFRVKGP